MKMGSLHACVDTLDRILPIHVFMCTLCTHAGLWLAIIYIQGTKFVFVSRQGLGGIRNVYNCISAHRSPLLSASLLQLFPNLCCNKGAEKRELILT